MHWIFVCVCVCVSVCISVYMQANIRNIANLQLDKPGQNQICEYVCSVCMCAASVSLCQTRFLAKTNCVC